mgnify:CR=1 FL=1
MLIYQWLSNTTLAKFKISDGSRKRSICMFDLMVFFLSVDLGFHLDQSKSAVLSIFYAHEGLHSNDKSGVILTISKLKYITERQSN